MAPLYVRGLLGSGGRKSVQPMAERLGLSSHDPLHQFISSPAWDDAPLWRVLAEQVDRQVGGEDAVLVVDDVGVPKKGELSVGVARQYCGELGKVANCQVLVSLTLARGEVPRPVGLRLFLPSVWTDDPERCDEAGVPEAARMAQSKPAIALAEIDRVRAAGVRFACVLADAGFGSSPDFRHGLDERELAWAAGIACTQLVYPTTVKLRPTYTPTGRPAKHPVPNRPPLSAADMLDKQRWRRITWRTGTKGPLNARFAAVRVRVADGPCNAENTRLPGEELWLIGEWRDSGETKYYLSNLPKRTTLRRLVVTVKARWSCEQVHQQLKQELGLGDFEGRSWTGLHRHALMTCIAFAYLQHRRLKAAGRGKKAGPQRTAATAVAA
jgi:SRSO17 transposase